MNPLPTPISPIVPGSGVVVGASKVMVAENVLDTYPFDVSWFKTV